MHKTIIFLAICMTSVTLMADSAKPTCKEEPTRRDCIKVEDPNATSPKHTIDKEKPSHPIATPLPAPGPVTTPGPVTGNSAKGR